VRFEAVELAVGQLSVELNGDRLADASTICRRKRHFAPRIF
jgi:hypothetical protein